MKFFLTAMTALVAAGSVRALTPTQIQAARIEGTLKEVYVAGSAIQGPIVAAWFKQQCKPSTYDVHFGDSGYLHRAYSCELGRKVGNWISGTKLLLAYKRDWLESPTTVEFVVQGKPQDFMDVDSSCVATGEPSPATHWAIPGYICNGLRARLADAGISDADPELLQKPVNLQPPAVVVDTAVLDRRAFAQIVMAVAVNKKLYRALQAAQGRTPDDSPANMPTLSSTFVSAALSGRLSGSTADKRGWNLVIPASVDPDVLVKQVNVCRRSIGAGLQALVNAQFMNAGCGTGPVSVHPVLGQTTGAESSTYNVSPPLAETGTLAWRYGSTSGFVDSCLGALVEQLPGAAYGIGVLSRDTDPLSPSLPERGYRFVRLDGIVPSRDNAKLGKYAFVHQTSMHWNKAVLTDGDVRAFLTSLRMGGSRPVVLADTLDDVGTYGDDDYDYRDPTQGLMTPPWAYSGAYDDISPFDDVILKFASRVGRHSSADNCSPLRQLK